MKFSGSIDSPSLALAIELAERVQAIGKRRSFITALSITSVVEVRDKLHRTAGQIVYGLTHGFSIDDVIVLIDQLSGLLQMAVTVDILTSKECNQFLDQVDKLSTTIAEEMN